MAKGIRVEIEFLGEPKTKSNALKFTRTGHTYIDSKPSKYEKALRAYIKEKLGEWVPIPRKTLIRADLVYYYGSKRIKDLQNLPKSTFDAMNKLVYEDDFQIHEFHVRRRLDRKNPRVHIIITETSDKEWDQG